MPWWSAMRRQLQLWAAEQRLSPADAGRAPARHGAQPLFSGCGWPLPRPGALRALEEAAGVEAEVFGPTKAFFDSVLGQLHAEPTQAIMIGDDLVADIQGAQEAGIPAILVRTGKFRPAEDSRIRPAQIADDFATAVDWLLAQRESTGV